MVNNTELGGLAVIVLRFKLGDYVSQLGDLVFWRRPFLRETEAPIRQTGSLSLQGKLQFPCLLFDNSGTGFLIRDTGSPI